MDTFQKVMEQSGLGPTTWINGSCAPALRQPLLSQPTCIESLKSDSILSLKNLRAAMGPRGLLISLPTKFRRPFSRIPP